MVLQVGDKVLVYGAGTPWSFAKRIEPLQVGDTVDVVTLSDGTKLSLPRINLDLDDYVWLLPEWPTPSFPIDRPFSWGILPLGASVFTLSSIIDCWTVEDDVREWDDGQLSGCLLIMLSGDAAKARLPINIIGNSETRYNLGLDAQSYYLTYEDFTQDPEYPGYFTLGDSISGSYSGPYNISPWATSPALSMTGMGKCQVTWKLLSTNSLQNTSMVIYNSGLVIDLRNYAVRADAVLTPAEIAEYGLYPYSAVNPDYPNFTTTIVNTPLSISGTIQVRVACRAYYRHEFTINRLLFFSETCITTHMAAGDQYVIYDPVTKRLVFNDSTKTVLAAAYWRDITAPGEEIATTAVEYVWDGQGHVYLSSSKLTFSTIQFDDELRVDATAANTTKTIAYHQGERITVSGETVSRELTEITSILRAGKNSVVLTVRHDDGNKVGYVSPVYIKRSMTPVTL